MMVVDNFNGWLDLGLSGGWWRSWVWVRKRETEKKREERWKRRKIGSFIFILLFDDGSLYYFNELYVKIEIKMLSEL